MIVTLELAPGAVVREDLLQQQLGLGRTPIREALQRLVRDQFVTIIPRRGMYVSSIDVSELSTLYETRAILEPYVMRLAAPAAAAADWDAMAAALARATVGQFADTTVGDRPRVPRDRLGGSRQPLPHRHARHAVRPERSAVAPVPLRRRRTRSHDRRASAIHAALVDGDGERAATLIESHMRAFNDKIADAVRRRLESPLAGY